MSPFAGGEALCEEIPHHGFDSGGFCRAGIQKTINMYRGSVSVGDQRVHLLGDAAGFDKIL